MRKIKLLQINWYKLLTVAFLVSLFVVSPVEAAYTQKENTDTNIVKNTLNTYKEIFSQAQLKSSSLAAVGSSLTSISDSLAEGWISFSKIILNNFIEKANDTKDFVSSVFDEMSFIQEKVVDSFSSNPSTVENKVEKKKDIKQGENKVQVSNSSSSNLLSNLQNSITSKTEIVKEVTSVRGEQGPKGDTGAMGPMGPVGPQGPKGERGSSGRDVDTSDFVLNSFFENQIDRLFDSISEDIDSSSDSITEGGTLNDSILNRPVLNNATGTFLGTLTGNADTVTNGLYSTGSYSNPTWLTAIPYSILSGTIPTWNQDTTGNAATVTNGLYSTGSYSDPSWLTISKSKVGLANVDNTADADKPISTLTQNALNLKSNLSGATFTGSISATNLSGTNTGDQTLSGLGGVPTSRLLTINGSSFDLSGDRSWTISDITGNAGTVTNGLYSTGSYSDPSWLTISKSKVGLSNVDNTSDATKSVLYASTSGNASTVTNGLYSTSSYANPTWLTAIPYSILSGTIPTWNQDTTGNAATVTNGVYTSRTINGKALSSDVTISAGDLGLGNVTNESKATMFTSPTFTGTVGGFTIGGDIIPSLDNTHSLGSSTSVWKDVYVGNGSIYVDGQKVLQTNDDKSVVVSSDVNQNLIMKTSGTGDIEFNPSGTGIIRLKGNLLLSGTKTFETSDNSAVIFADGISSPTITTSVLNGGISITPNGSGNTYITSGYLGIGTTLPRATLDVVGNMVLGNNTLNNSLLSIYSTDDGSYSHGITIVDKEAKYGSWQNPSGLDGITTDDAGTPNGWNTLFLNYYSTEDISFNQGGGNSIFSEKIGVGTTTPAAKLDIQSLATGIGTEDLFKVGLDANWYLKLQQNWNAGGLDYNFIQQAGAGAENNFNVLSFSKGNVGIGTTSPSTKLHIKDSTSALIRLQTAGTGEGGIEWADTSNSVLGSIKQSSNTGDITTYIGTSPKMTVQYATGNVGIGTTTPSKLLEIAGSNNVAVKLNRSGENAAGLELGVYNRGYLYANTGYNLTLGAGGVADYVTILAAGNVGIGTSTPLEALHVVGNIRNSVLAGTGNRCVYANASGNLAVSSGDCGVAGTGNTVDTLSATLGAGNDAGGQNMINLGNVGIGSTSAREKLEIGGLYPKLRLSYDTTNFPTSFYGYAYHDGLNGLKLESVGAVSYGTGNNISFIRKQTGGTNNTMMFLEGATGNVGIGTTEPSTDQLVIKSAIAGAGRQLGIDSLASGYSQINFLDNGTTKWRLRKESSNEFDIYSDTLGAPVLHAKENGNVGIGTNSPGKKLDVEISGSAQDGIRLMTGGLELASFTTTGATGEIRIGGTSAPAGAFFPVFYANGAERMRLNTSGNLGIGTTEPGGKLSIQNGVNGGLLLDAYTGIGWADSYGKIQAGSYAFGGGTATSLVINPDGGNVGIGTTNPGAKVEVSGIAYGELEALRLTNVANVAADRGTSQTFYIPTGTASTRLGGKLFVATNAAVTGSYMAFSTETAYAGGVSEKMRIDNLGNVGIGTMSPEANLDIHGLNKSLAASATQAGNLRVATVNEMGQNIGGSLVLGGRYITGDPTIIAYGTISGRKEFASSGNNAGYLAFETADNSVAPYTLERMRITGNGNVGIGTTNPLSKLDVSTSVTEALSVGNSSATISNGDLIGALAFVSRDSSTNSSGAIGSIRSYAAADYNTGSVSGDLRFYVSNFAQPNGSMISGDEVMRINNSGNVGIGTTSPSVKLDVGGDGSFGSSSGATVSITTNGNNGSTVSPLLPKLDFRGYSNSNLVSLRATEQAGNGWDSKLSILVNAGGGPADLIERVTITGVTGNVGIGTMTPGNILTIQQTSATDPIADAWTTYSSGRWKENREPIVNALEKINELNPVYFDWTADHGGAHDLGFIAEEVGLIIPEVVAWEDNGVDAKSIDYARLSTIAIAGIKEMNLKIAVLDNDINGITLKEMLSDFFGSVVVNVTDGVASIKGLVVETLKVGSPAKRTGITLYDEETGEPYCISVAGGQAKTVPGECGVIDIEKIAEEKAAREAAEQAERDAASAAEAQEALRQQELLNATGAQQQAPTRKEPTPEELAAQEAARLAEIAEAERLAAEQAAAAEAERLAAEQAAQQSAEQQTPPAEESTTPTSDTTTPPTPAGE